MNASQLKTAGEQLLNHYRRSGITFVPSWKPDNVEQALAWLDDVEPHWRSVETQEVTSKVASGTQFMAAQRQPSSQELPKTLGTHQAALAAPLQEVSFGTLASERANALPIPVRSNTNPVFKSVLGEMGTWPQERLSPEERTHRFQQLNAEVMACRKCEEIACRRQRTVFGVGPVDAKIVMFGEAPGADEDRIGEPFVGAAGQLLDKILIASGLKRESVYILNALKCRPPNNRTPVDEEIENCRPFFETQLDTIQPDYIVCWGAVAVRSVLQSTESIGRLRGRFHAYRGAKVMVTYHPSYLLRNLDAKKLTWEDMKILMRELGISLPPK